MAFPVELGFILLFSILGGILAVRLRQPSVLGLIFVGAVVGLEVFRASSLIHFITKRHEARFNKFSRKYKLF